MGEYNTGPVQSFRVDEFHFEAHFYGGTKVRVDNAERDL
jgi:hypothetical protein